MARFAPKYARRKKRKEEKPVENKPESWQRRGLFALISRRGRPDDPPEGWEDDPLADMDEERPRT